MTFKSFSANLMKRTGPAYGAGPAGFRRLLKRLANPQNAYKIIHVAGTNGKGSVCCLCAEILRAAGHTTGLFISPHLHCPTERIQINGHNIPRAQLQRLCKQVLAAEKEKLNFFEIITAAAFLYFAEKKADWVVLETGLGGRKDPTNVCVPAACAITSVGLDHCAILGDTLQKIAREKAGIIKSKVPVFCPQFSSEIWREIRAAAKQKKAPLHLVKPGQLFKLTDINWRNGEMILQKGAARWRLHLLGEKQVQNAGVVYQACRALHIPEKAIKQGFARVQMPARFEIVRWGKKTIILDGAHNPQAIENLMTFLQKSPWATDIAVVCGFMSDKDYPAMLRALAKNAAALYITTPGGPRAACTADVKSALPHGAQASCFNRPAQAVRAALEAHQTVLVTGSFYLAASVRTRLLALARRKKD